MPISTIGTDGLSTSPTLTTPKATTTIGVGNATPAASGAGITFPATQSASTNANTLDDYEEGTWTPSVGGTATHANQIGTYTKIGNVVVVTCNLYITTIGTGSTTTISGYPFPFVNDGTIATLNFAYWGGLTQSLYFLSGYGSGGTASSVFSGVAATSGTIGNAIPVIGSGTNLYFTAIYRTT